MFWPQAVSSNVVSFDTGTGASYCKDHDERMADISRAAMSESKGLQECVTAG
ncbi:hypothetical protein [Pararhizobium sp. DWP3-4]|uniref:hypothetical protein n=1 Tax=Pararhizobium sp. DWP3-4 TaxID=2804565 RepID=UPI003CEEF89E